MSTTLVGAVILSTPTLTEVRLRSFALVALLALAVLGGAMHFVYGQRVQGYRHQAERELLAIATLQADGVASWREQRISDALSLTDDALLSHAVGQWLAAPSEVSANAIGNRLRILVERARYTAVFLVDVDGHVQWSSQGQVLGELPEAEHLALKTALNDAVATDVDPRQDAFFAFPFFSQMAPLFDGIQPVGAVWLVSDVRTSLYPLTQAWPSPSESAESVIVSRRGQDAWLLSPLRHASDGGHSEGAMPYPLTDAQDPVVQATRGARGIFEARDYRGQSVIAMAAAVPESDWLLLAKVDEAEVLADSRWRELLALSVPVAVCLVLVGLGFSWWLHQAWRREQVLKSQLERNMHWLESAQEAASIGYFAHDLSTAEVSLSSMGCAILGLPQQPVFSQEQWLSRLEPEDLEGWLAQYRQAMAARTPLHAQLRIRRTDDEVTRWVDVWGSFEHDRAHPSSPRLLGTVQDITERKRVEDELQSYRTMLEDKVRHDPLTRLANRRALDESVQSEWFRAIRNHMPLSVVMIDVDHFKAYNDHYGHVAGDHCLQQIASALDSAVIRSGELVARYGGEEFAVLLPNTPSEQAMAVGERVVAAVAALRLPHAHSSAAPWVTVSAGVACVQPVFVASAPAGEAPNSPRCAAAETLFEQADAALYEAKQQGRNRVVLSSQSVAEVV